MRDSNYHAQTKRCRADAYTSRMSQAERRVKKKKKKKKRRLDFKPGEPGNSVVVTPLVDRGRGDSFLFSKFTQFRALYTRNFTKSLEILGNL